MNNFKIPDSKISQEGFDIVQAAASPSLVAHSLRSFFFAKAYAEKKGVRFDEEGLFLSAVFHDLGLCHDYMDRTNPFTFSSSQQLHHFLAERQIPSERISLLTEAIDFHFQLFPRWSKGAEVGLMQVGAWMDVTGLRRWSIHQEAQAIDRAFLDNVEKYNVTSHVIKSMGSLRACVGLFLPGIYRGINN